MKFVCETSSLSVACQNVQPRGIRLLCRIYHRLVVLVVPPRRHILRQAVYAAANHGADNNRGQRPYAQAGRWFCPCRRNCALCLLLIF